MALNFQVNTIHTLKCICKQFHSYYTCYIKQNQKQMSIRHPDVNMKQVASNQLRKIKSKDRLSLQQFPQKVPESLRTSPSIKWSPNCLKAVQHVSEDKKDDHTKQNIVCKYECRKLASIRMEHKIIIINIWNHYFWQHLLI